MRHLTRFFLILALAVGLTGSAANAGIVMITGDDADDFGHCSGGGGCGGLFANAFSLGISSSVSPGSGIVAIGVNGGPASSNLTAWNTAGPNVGVTILTSAAAIAGVNFANYDMVYIPSSSNNTSGGINSTQLAALNARAADIQTFVNTTGGSLIALTEAGLPGAWGWLPFGLVTVNGSFTQVAVTPAMTVSPGVSPTTTNGNLSHCCFHNVFTSASVTASGFVSLADAVSAGGLSGNPTYIFATVISPENCTDGIDNDNDGLIDSADPDCHICGNNIVDPGEECDDGNLTPGDGCDSMCMNENAQCVAMCTDVEVSADPSACDAGASIDDGSMDPDGDMITLSQDPPGPYSVGMTDVTLSCTDGSGLPADTCMGKVTVTDDTPPVALCNAPGTITPPDAPIMFTGGAVDACGATVEITGFDCFKYTQKGKRIDKTESCVVSIDGDKITILDSGGVDDHITWTVKATDSNGNMSETECEILVENPGQGGMRGRL